ncbi:MAG: hypothetical protein HKO65_07660 [Gemmatimonadetes bacterium]|nr:hypothetical protein [Gemmatimonadota bacterium]NNM04965.1 hypothetical protein [Gemmatimonadota bacterium]
MALVIVPALIGFAVPPLVAQEPPSRFERRVEATRPPVSVFHSTQAINLPTAETLSQGEWQFEIAHRFLPAVSEGSDALWGLDGPANMRLGLGYAPLDQLLVTLARSNFMDNWDLRAKLKVLEHGDGPFPLMAAIQGGVSWSSDVPERDSGDPGNFQYYGQLIVNTLVAERLAVGVVPSYLYNVLLDRIDPVQDLFWGFYGQLYLTDVVSVNAEWALGGNGAELDHDAGSFGIELETGGHFFKVFLTNSVRLNPTQFLVGTDFAFEPDEWRLGFAITRLLRF